MVGLENDDLKIEVLRLKNEGYSSRRISAQLGISKTTVNDFLSKKTFVDWWEKNDKPFAQGEKVGHLENIRKLEGKTFILTSVQNNTWCHKDFLKALEVMAKEKNAQILVSGYTYNKHGFNHLEKTSDECWYDPLITKYLVSEPLELAEGLIFCANLNISPTASNPLASLGQYSRGNTIVVPHAKIQLESIPRIKYSKPRFMVTTGTLTLQNYMQKRTGQIASNFHAFGAVIVEVADDGEFFFRNISAESDTGNFYDLDTYYTPEGSTKITETAGLYMGDLHSEKRSPIACNATFGHHENSQVEVLRPKYIMVGDSLDFEAKNHHNVNDPYFRYETWKEGKDCVENNIKDVVEVLREIKRDYSKIVVVESNHDLALTRYLKETNYKNDPKNAIFILKCELATYQAMDKGDKKFSIFEHVVKEMAPDLEDVKFLRIDEEFKVGDILVSQHGHLGLNGARGSASSFEKIGVRICTGHGHSPIIKSNVYVAGFLGTEDMGYNKGNTTWAWANILIHPNNKRQMLIINPTGNWRRI